MEADFSQIPSWVRWITQEANGAVWVYEHEPNRSDVAWYENEVGRYQKWVQGEPNQKWAYSPWSESIKIINRLEQVSNTFWELYAITHRRLIAEYNNNNENWVKNNENKKSSTR